jgi:hypothetical protein
MSSDLQRVDTQDFGPGSGSDNPRIDLARSLGLSEYPGNLRAEPYLIYIENHCFSTARSEEYMRLFIHVIRHFKAIEGSDGNDSTKSIALLLGELLSISGDDYFPESQSDSQERREDVEDAVMYIIGTWTMMLSSFVVVPIAGGIRKVTMAYNMRTQDGVNSLEPHEQSVSALVKGSGLLPDPDQNHFTGNSSNDDITQTALKLIKLLSINPSSSASCASSFKAPMDLSGETINPPQPPTYRNMPPDFLDLESHESLSISATRLNALTLHILGTVSIEWTYNISRHLILSKRNGQHHLQVFALPCAFEAPSFAEETTGIPTNLLHEIRESYSILFNAWPTTPLHAKLGLRFCCWCWACSAHRYRGRAIADCKRACALESRRRHAQAKRSRLGVLSTKTKTAGAARNAFDPMLLALMEYDASSDWTYDMFPHLWARITALEMHLQGSRPWSIWVLFRDRRDTLQFWTFL